MIQTITLPPSIRIGASASIEIQNEDGSREYKSRVEDIENGLLVVALPSERGELLQVSSGQFVTLAVQTASGSNLFVEAEVMGRRTSPFPVMVARPVSIESNQQRLFHRVQVVIEPTGVWRWVGQSAPSPTSRPSATNANWERVKGMIVDVSGGGVGFLSETELARETHIVIRFPLPAIKEPFEAYGKVMMCRPRPQGAVVRYQHGIKFEGVSKSDQERLIRANHQYQIEERRRARGL